MENADVANGQNNILFSCHIDGRYWNVSIYLAKKKKKKKKKQKTKLDICCSISGVLSPTISWGFKSNKCKLGLEREVDT